MSSYDIIRHASHILFRVSCSGLPETAVGEMATVSAPAIWKGPRLL